MRDETLVYAMMCLWKYGYPASLSPPYSDVKKLGLDFRGYQLIIFKSEADLVSWRGLARDAADRADILWDYDRYEFPRSRPLSFIAEMKMMVKQPGLELRVDDRSFLRGEKR